MGHYHMIEKHVEIVKQTSWILYYANTVTFKIIV